MRARPNTVDLSGMNGNPYSLAIVANGGTRAQRIAAHLALHAPRAAPAAAGDHRLLQQFVENLLMKRFSSPRGE